MPDRKTSFPTPWIWIALALLAWISPGPARLEAVSVLYACRAVDLASPADPPVAALDAAVPIEDLPQITALPSEGEEQDQVDALADAPFSYPVPCSFRQVADRRLTVPCATPSPYPLRC